MRTSLPAFIAIVFMINSCKFQMSQNYKEFTLQGEIIGQDSGIIVLSYHNDKTSIHDTSKIENGKFIFTGKLSEPAQAILSDKNDFNRVFIFLEPQNMKISFSKDKYEECLMTGSKTQNESDLLNKMVKPFYDRISIQRNQIKVINDSIKNSKNATSKLSFEKKTDEIDKIWSQNRKKIDSVQIRFVVENPKSFLSVVYLQMLGGREVISLDSTKSIFNGLDNSLKESSYGKNIRDNIRKKENVMLGAQAPDFKATDLNQQNVSLSQFKGGSIVLIDFWASWCVPCSESLPHLRTIYDKYHSKGFDIIAVSTDTNRKSWIDAVKQNKTEMWYHILIAEKWPNGPLTNDDIFQNYYNTAIPEQILIDKNGKIIYRHVGYSKESEKSLDQVLSQIIQN
jgi:peroxiredoxin